jgi:hypothetical protein
VKEGAHIVLSTVSARIGCIAPSRCRHLRDFGRRPDVAETLVIIAATATMLRPRG